MTSSRFTRSRFAYLAPGVAGYHRVVLPGDPHSGLISVDDHAVDDHAVEPETRQELIAGQIVRALPAEAPHGDAHHTLDYVLGASVARGYVGSTDLLTRTSKNWNFAADASIRKEGRDPATGGRYLEELAFEVKHTQSMSKLTDRAGELVKRGVRRVFAICVAADESEVTAGSVFEWRIPKDNGDNNSDNNSDYNDDTGENDRAKPRWVELDPDSEISDPCLHTAIKVRALIDAVEADNAVARALVAKGNPVLVERDRKLEAASYDRGKIETRRQILVELLAQRFGDLPGTARQCIEQAGMAELERWTGRVIPAATLTEVFAEVYER